MGRAPAPAPSAADFPSMGPAAAPAAFAPQPLPKSNAWASIAAGPSALQPQSEALMSDTPQQSAATPMPVPAVVVAVIAPPAAFLPPIQEAQRSQEPWEVVPDSAAEGQASADEDVSFMDLMSNLGVEAGTSRLWLWKLL